ncbi:MAG: response regulator [Deltaproteobacteria bacterium]|jgi:signal transduction histidine kinase/CheY-like chemotaxis protein|nr:response regulator [Deltaproteobacteria bacterium]
MRDAREKKTIAKLVALVIVAFLIMTLASYFYVSMVMKRQLDLFAQNEIVFYQTSLRALIQSNEDALTHASAMMALSLDKKATSDELLEVLRALSSVFKTQKDIQNVFQSIYGFIDGNFIDDSGFISGAFFSTKTAPWLRGAILSNGLYHAEPAVNPRSGVAVASISNVIFDSKGESRGVLAIDYLLDPIVRQVSSFKVGNVGFGVLTDRGNSVLTYPDPQYVGASLDQIPGFESLAERLPDDQARILIERFESDGVSYIGFFSSLENGWHLGVVAPLNFYYAEVFDTFPAILLISLALAAVLSFVLIQLNRAKNRSEEENRLKSSFLARMSHEIRTPMNAIIGLSELVHRDYGNPEGLGYVSEIRKAGNNLLGIINDILDFSKIESGKYQLHVGEYQTANLLSDVIGVAEARVREKPIFFLTEISPTLPKTLLGDDRGVRQVLINLLSNAIKYTDHGQIKLTAASEEIAEGEIRLIFSISDSGVGIKKEDIQKLFGVFVRLEDGATDHYVEGSGLGLSIAKSIANLMDGDVSCQSEFGIGSVFTATFRQKVLDPTPLESFLPHEQTPKTPMGLAPFQAPNFKILVVDDIRVNLVVASGLLSPYGARVTTALSGEEAVALAKGEKFDLLLIDQMMPELDGVATLKKIRDLSELNRATPAVAFTANALKGARDLLISQGFDDFISKPIEGDELNDILLKWVPEEHWGAPAEGSAFPPPESAGADEAAAGANGDATGAAAAFARARLVKGLDASLGLKRVRGSPEKYVSVLKTFLLDAEAIAPFLNAALKTNGARDFKNLAIRVHALKTAYANIGATEFSAKALDLETALNQENEMVFANGDFASFAENLGLFSSGLKEALSPPPALRASTASFGFTKGDLLNLKGYIEAKNIQNADILLEEISARCDPASLEIFTEIAENILVSDFAKALENVAKISSS